MRTEEKVTAPHRRKLALPGNEKQCLTGSGTLLCLMLNSPWLKCCTHSGQPVDTKIKALVRLEF